MNEPRTDESKTEYEYDPERYVSDVWTEELTAAGLTKHQADQIRQLTFGDPQLSLEDPSPEDVLRVVIEAVRQFEFEKVVDGESGIPADELRERLIHATYAGLTGQLLGPAAAPSDVALDNEGISTVELEGLDWRPSGTNGEPPEPIEQPSAELGPSEMKQAMMGRQGFNSEIQTRDEDRVTEVLETLASVAEADPSTEVRVAAIESLGSIAATAGDAERGEVVQFLRERLEADEAAVRAAAANALAEALAISRTTLNDDTDDDPSEPRSADPFS